MCLRAAGVCLGGGGHTHYEVDEPDRRLGDDVSVPIVQWIHLPPPCAVYVALVVEFRVPACPGARVCALCCIVGAYSLPYIHVTGSRKPAYPTKKKDNKKDGKKNPGKTTGTITAAKTKNKTSKLRYTSMGKRWCSRVGKWYRKQPDNQPSQEQQK